jgi:hypothetical protein
MIPARPCLLCSSSHLIRIPMPQFHPAKDLTTKKQGSVLYTAQYFNDATVRTRGTFAGTWTLPDATTVSEFVEHTVFSPSPNNM